MSAKSRMFNMGLYNEGKLNESKLLMIADSASHNGLDIAFISEAAMHRSPLQHLESEMCGYTFIGPKGRVKGGAGFLIKKNLLGKKKVQLRCHEDHEWGLAILPLYTNVLLIAAYLTPSGNRCVATLRSLLDALNATIPTNTKVIIAGDFNAPSHTVRRRELNAWFALQNISILNQNINTHKNHNATTDLDLIAVRGLDASLLNVAVPAVGHARLYWRVQFANQSPISQSNENQVAWNKLQNKESVVAFNESLNTILFNCSHDFNASLYTAAVKSLGLKKPKKPARFHWRVRKQIREIRKELKQLSNETDEFKRKAKMLQSLIIEQKRKNWQKRMESLTDENGKLNQRPAYALLRQLYKEYQKEEGFSNEQIAQTYEEVYNKNKAHDIDWENRVNTALSMCQKNISKYPALDDEFTVHELRDVIYTLPRHKAYGVDNIPHEAYLAIVDNEYALRYLCKEYNTYLSSGWLEETQSKLVLIPKKDFPVSPTQMRPLLIMPTYRKILECLILRRINQCCGIFGCSLISAAQAGFQKGMSSTRQLMLLNLAINDSLVHGKELRLVSFDLEKAFDSVPTYYILQSLAKRFSEFGLRLFRLVCDMLLCPRIAVIGDKRFTISTGVPQGGIISPWLFIMAMEELIPQISQPGYTLADSTNVGCLLYADDICILDESEHNSQQKTQSVQKWAESWGGKLNIKKTNYLVINRQYNVPPSIYGQAVENDSGPFTYLGLTVSETGLKSTKDLVHLTASTCRLAPFLSKKTGLPPFHILQLIRSTSWSQVAYGSELTLPPYEQVMKAWFQTMRCVLSTYPCTHSVEIQKELGLLWSPSWWMTISLIRSLCKTLQGTNDALLTDITRNNLTPQHPYRKEIEKRLSVLGITWDHLTRIPSTKITKFAMTQFSKWSSEQIKNEGTRLGVYDATDPAWAISQKPASYLKFQNARYGFLFRLNHFGPSNMQKAPCCFCGEDGGDSGLHVSTVCNKLPSHLLLPPQILALSSSSRFTALRLENQTPPAIIKLVLNWMKTVWQERKMRWVMANTTNAGFIKFSHNPRFMCPLQIQNAINASTNSSRNTTNNRTQSCRSNNLREYQKESLKTTEYIAQNLSVLNVSSSPAPKSHMQAGNAATPLLSVKNNSCTIPNVGFKVKFRAYLLRLWKTLRYLCIAFIGIITAVFVHFWKLLSFIFCCSAECVRFVLDTIKYFLIAITYKTARYICNIYSAIDFIECGNFILYYIRACFQRCKYTQSHRDKDYTAALLNTHPFYWDDYTANNVSAYRNYRHLPSYISRGSVYSTAFVIRNQQRHAYKNKSYTSSCNCKKIFSASYKYMVNRALRMIGIFRGYISEIQFRQNFWRMVSATNMCRKRNKLKQRQRNNESVNKSHNKINDDTCLNNGNEVDSFRFCSESNNLLNSTLHLTETVNNCSFIEKENSIMHGYRKISNASCEIYISEDETVDEGIDNISLVTSNDFNNKSKISINRCERHCYNNRKLGRWSQSELAELEYALNIVGALHYSKLSEILQTRTYRQIYDKVTQLQNKGLLTQSRTGNCQKPFTYRILTRPPIM